MLGRAATRIELNRDSDMDELEQEKTLRQSRQVPTHQQPFGARMGRVPQSNLVHSIFTNDSSSSGLGVGGPNMLHLPNFQTHNIDDQE